MTLHQAQPEWRRMWNHGGGVPWRNCRKGSAEVRRDYKRFERFVRELFSKKMGETVAELLVRKLAGAALKFPANEFEPVRFGAAKALDGEGQPLFGAIGNRQDAAREVKLIRPRCSNGFSPLPRTSHDMPEKGATRPPFSRTSTTPEAVNSRRLACSSAANSMAEL